MAVLNANGFSIRDFNTIVQAIRTRAATNEFFGEDIDTTPDSALGILINLFASSVLDQEELAQAVYDQFNRDKAEGKNLDDLAALIGLTRLNASGSTGDLLFTGSNGINIPQNFQVSDDQNRVVRTSTDLTLNRNTCNISRFSISTVTTGAAYSINIEGTLFTYTSQAGDDAAAIIAGLHAAIGDRTTFSSSIEENTTLVITLTAATNTLTTSNTPNIQLDSVSSLVRGTAFVTGAVTYPANSITRIVNALAGVTSVTNPLAFTLGRAVETDAELRVRLANREESTGTATIPAIEASISEITGVTNVLVIENPNTTPDSDNRPPKSYETFVAGGSTQAIGQRVWETKPAGIQTVGDISVTVTDSKSRNHTVRFSRPTELFAHVRVTYTRLSEEDFPLNGEEAIRQAVLTFGNALNQGDDVIPQRFNAAIFNQVGGIESLTTEIGLTTTSSGTPTYTQSRIPVSRTQFVNFDSSRVTVSI